MLSKYKLYINIILSGSKSMGYKTVTKTICTYLIIRIITAPIQEFWCLAIFFVPNNCTEAQPI